MKDNTYLFGIIGCGMIADFHAEAIKRIGDARLKGVVDANPEHAEKFARKQGVKAFADIDEMFGDRDIDIVCICTPSGLHAQQAITAADAGKHVVVEKPMALSLEDADRIIAACERNHVKMEIISQLRFSDALVKVKKALENKELGKIVSGDIYMKYYRSGDYYANAGWRGTWRMDGGGALMNQGIHGVDLLRYLMGPVKSLYAYTRTLTHKIEVEDTAAAVLEFENGALGVIQAATSVYPGYSRRLEICGDKGSIVLEEDRIVKWDIEGAEVKEPEENGKPISSASGDPAAISVNGHVMQLKDIIRAVKEDSEPLVSAREGRKALEIILSIYESSKTNKPVILKEPREAVICSKEV